MSKEGQSVTAFTTGKVESFDSFISDEGAMHQVVFIARERKGKIVRSQHEVQGGFPSQVGEIVRVRNTVTLHESGAIVDSTDISPIKITSQKNKF